MKVEEQKEMAIFQGHARCFSGDRDTVAWSLEENWGEMKLARWMGQEWEGVEFLEVSGFDSVSRDDH